MIKNENILSKLLLIFAVIFAIVFVYLYTLFDKVEPYYILLALFTLVNIVTLAYKQSKNYKKKNNIKNLIKREGQWLVCQSTSVSSPSIIAIDKIGEITISSNYLSFIEIGNGQGYDFQIKSKANIIMSHLNELLQGDELKGIKVVLV